MSQSWDAAAAMARRSIQAAIREKRGTGRGLKDEIDDMVKRGLLTQQLADWAHEIRFVGNVGAHPDEGDLPVSSQDAQQATYFAYQLAHYLYTMPEMIEGLRKGRNGGEGTPAPKAAGGT